MYQSKPGFIRLVIEPTHIETFFVVKDVRIKINDFESAIKRQANISPVLLEAIAQGERYRYEVTYTKTVKEARVLQEEYLAKFNSFDLFIGVGLPTVPGLYRIIDKATGAYYMGRGTNIRGGYNNYVALLKGLRGDNLARDPRMQAAFNERGTGAFSVQFQRFDDADKMEATYNQIILEAANDPLLANDPKTKKKGRHTNGVYILTSTTNGEFYIGSSQDVYHRMSHHRCALVGGYHNSPKMLEHYQQYGWDFKIEFFLVESRKEAYRLEQHLLNERIEHAACLNSSKDSESPISGVFVSEEARRAGHDKLRREELPAEAYVNPYGKAGKEAWAKYRDRLVTPERSAANSKRTAAMHQDPEFRKKRLKAMAAYNCGGRFTYQGTVFASGKEAAAKTGVGVNRLRQLVHDPDCKDWYITIPDDRKAAYEAKLKEIDDL